MKIRIPISVLALLLIGATICPAATLVKSSPVEYFNNRMLSMGGAGIAALQGAETVYSNPAGIVDAGDHFNLPLVPLGLTNTTLFGSADLFEVGYVLSDGISQVDSSSDKANKQFDKIIPRRFGVGGSIPFGYTGKSPWPGFGSHMAIAGHVSAWGDYKLLNPVSPYIEFKGKVDTVYGITFARAVADVQKIIPQFSELKAGFTIKRIERQTYYDIDKDSETEKITITDVLNENISYGYATATGWGLDFGLMGAAETWIGRGRWGLAVYNIGASLTGVSSLSTPETEWYAEGEVLLQVPVTAKLGWAVENTSLKDITGGFFLMPTTMAIDWDLVYPTQSFAKRFHFGLEQPLTDWFAFQLGLNQGYGTAGIQFKWPFYRFSVAYYTQEMGPEIGIDPRSYYSASAGLLF